MRIPPARSAYLVGVAVTVALTALLTWGPMAPGYLLYRGLRDGAGAGAQCGGVGGRRGAALGAGGRRDSPHDLARSILACPEDPSCRATSAGGIWRVVPVQHDQAGQCR